VQSILGIDIVVLGTLGHLINSIIFKNMIYIYTKEHEARIVRIDKKKRSEDLASADTYKEYIVPDDFDLSVTVKDENGDDIVLQDAILYADFISRYNNDYKSKRTSSYPSIEEQLDMQYWDSVNGTTTWKDSIAKIKSDNPKS
jgi:hypothetical protein